VFVRVYEPEDPQKVDWRERSIWLSGVVAALRARSVISEGSRVLQRLKEII